jgi:hypothetical protein
MFLSLLKPKTEVPKDGENELKVVDRTDKGEEQTA